MNRMEQLERELQLSKQRIEQLEGLESSYQNLFEYAGDSIFLIDPRSLKILEANKNAARRLGYTMAELLQLTLEDIEVADKDNSTALAWESLYSGTQVYECRYKHKNGSLIPSEVSSRVVKIGNAKVFQNFVRDISKRKEIEEEREQLIRELDAFAHTVAHDLKHPLSMMVGYSVLLADEIETLPIEEAKEYAHHIEQASFKLESIIEELLLLASVRKLKEIDVAPLEMGGIVKEALKRLTVLTEKYQPQIYFPEEWPIALGHGGWIEEVWVNYLSNAIKFGGTPPIIEVGATVQDDNMIQFWVSDNGVGIPADKIPCLFNQFTRLEKSIEGNGLGLSIVQRIVDRMGGQVLAESTVGQGSKFSFTLPQTNRKMPLFQGNFT